MKLSKSKDHNPNYLASVVEITEFRPHPNADRLKMASIFGNNIITGIDAQPGIYLYFPLECAISEEFLSFTNSFREKEKNKDKEKAGMFDYHGRVRAVSLRASKSEGYIVPITQLQEFAGNLGLNVDIELGDFDEIGDHIICRKYIPRGQKGQGLSGPKTKGKIKKWESKLIENQFHFHPDSLHLKKEIRRINPEDYIAISNKLHGCNFLVANVLCKRKLSLWEKFARFFGAKIQESKYDLLYSSRTVIKNLEMNNGRVRDAGFYGEDIWKIVADKIFPSLAEGICVTGEIVGYTPSGGFIQKNFDYSCQPGQLDFYIFNVTYTSPSGHVYTFSHREMVAFCEKFGFKTPPVYYYGKARDLFDISEEEHWHENFLAAMMEKYLEMDCDMCNNKVPKEGVILRKDDPFEWLALKLKSFRFLEGESKQLDSGEVDLETQESNGE